MKSVARFFLILCVAGVAVSAWAAVTEDKLAEVERLVLARVQAERVKAHITPFTADTDLGKIARDRSIDMAARNAFAHANAAGENPYQIVAHSMPGFRGAIGENIMTDSVGASVDPDGTATRVVAAWMASAQHAANITSTMFDKVGVGAAEKHGTIYVTLLFSGPMPHH